MKPQFHILMRNGNGATGRVPYGTAAAQRLERVQALGWASVEQYDAAMARQAAQRVEDARVLAASRAIVLANDDIDDIPF